MAFTPATLHVVLHAISGGTFRLFSYETADEPATTTAADYFTDAATYGLKLNSLIIVLPESGNPYTLYITSIDGDGNGTAAIVHDEASSLVVETAADIADLTDNYSTITLQSYWDKATNPNWPLGGDILVRDPTAVGNADNIVSFPAATGLYKRDTRQVLRASQAGLISSTSLDQSIRLQAFINACYENEWQALFDVEDINCDGADIWVNPEGTAFSTGADVTARAFTMFGSSRRNTRILNAFLTFGKFYRVLNDVTVFTTTGDATHTYNIQNMHFEGITRFVNIEGCPHVQNCGFFASGTEGFYNSLPANWGIGDGETITTPYSAASHVVEAIACNHMTWLNNNVQNGTFYDDVEIGGMLCSQMGNLSIIGGRMNHNLVGWECGAHPVYGLTISDMVRCVGTHFESNTRQAIRLVGNIKAYVEAHIQGAGGLWDRANYPLMEVSGGQARDIHVNSYFTGVDKTSGTALKVAGVGCFITGHAQRVKTAVEIAAGAKNYSFGLFGLNSVALGTEFVIASNATPYRTPVAIAPTITPLSINKKVITLHEDFLDSALHARWTVLKGSDAQCVDFAIVVGSGASTEGTTGNDVGATHALNGVQIAGPLSWLPSAGGLSMTCRLKVSSPATMAIYVGFGDQNSVLEMPFTLSGTTLTSNITDGFGFLYDASSDNDKWTAVGVATDVDVQRETVLAPVANTYVTLRVEVDTAGIANFYINDALQLRSELVTNGEFLTDTTWTKGTGWTITPETTDADGATVDGYAIHAAGSGSDLSQAVTVTTGQTYTLTFRVVGRTAGSVTPNLTGGTPVAGTARSSNTFFEEDLVANGNTALAFTASADFDGKIQNIAFVQKGLTGAVTTSVALCPIIAAFSLAGASRTITIDHITVQQNR